MADGHDLLDHLRGRVGVTGICGLRAPDRSEEGAPGCRVRLGGHDCRPSRDPNPENLSSWRLTESEYRGPRTGRIDEEEEVHGRADRVRAEAGTHLNFFIYQQLPLLPPPPQLYTEPHLAFLVLKVLELTYTSNALAPFAQDLGHDGPRPSPGMESVAPTCALISMPSTPVPTA